MSIVLPRGLKGGECKEHIPSCSFETFDFVVMAGGGWQTDRSMLDWNLSPQQKDQLRAKIERVHDSVDRRSSFDAVATAKRKSYLKSEIRRKKNEEITAQIRATYGVINKIIEQEGFWNLFVRGMLSSGGGGQRCINGDDMGCIEELPVILLP